MSAPYGLAFDPVVNYAEDYNNSNGYGWLYNGDMAHVGMSLGGSAEATNVTIAAVFNAEGSYPATPSQSAIPGGPIGFLNVGSSATRSLASEYCPGDSCELIRYLYHSNQIPSYSFGMHIGSASLDYPGSLILGGFDKGRAIGEVVDWLNLQLLDVRMGVETGGSNFSFGAEKTGLLKADNSGALPLPVTADMTTPYIFLPTSTVDAITKVLPVYYDERSQYYLWNATDPSYTQLVQSPAYLGFDFVSQGGNTTIKIPFMLLDLTLEPEASGLENAVPYFPILPQKHGGRSVGSGYPLGRAFLQATFMGANWAQNVTWLAQAPGPGPDNQGLGLNIKDIAANDKSLDLATDGNLFNESWRGTWRPLPVSGNSHEDKGLGAGGIAGAVVGPVVVLGVVAAICVFIFKRRKDRKQDQPEKQHVVLRAEDTVSELPQQEKSELHGNGVYAEAPSEPVQQELSGQGRFHELAGDTGARELLSTNERYQRP